jgi:small multidrug resistance pump
MSWVYLALAIALEVAGTVCMKRSEGVTHLGPALAMLALYALGLGAMALAVKDIEVSVAYALWSGWGVALVALVGAVWFKEPMPAVKVGALALIVTGVVSLQWCERKAPLPAAASSVDCEGTPAAAELAHAGDGRHDD